MFLLYFVFQGVLEAEAALVTGRTNPRHQEDQELQTDIVLSAPHRGTGTDVPDLGRNVPDQSPTLENTPASLGNLPQTVLQAVHPFLQSRKEAVKTLKVSQRATVVPNTKIRFLMRLQLTQKFWMK